MQWSGLAWLLFAACVPIAAPQNSANTAPGPVARFGTVVVASGGFKGEVYHIRHWTKHLPNFAKLKPVGAIYTSVLNVPPQGFKVGFPGVTNRFEWFAIDYRARFWVQTPGAYHFSLLADDAADLYIDDDLIIDNDGQHSPLLKEGTVNITKGVHTMRVSYYQGPKYQVALVLEVEPPGQTAFRVFDTNDFEPPSDATNW